ncbi:MAG: metallophosphoesterase family protein [Massilibacteroides sp.]|nr:metallophosphoesterase family protein [Massilibacteroides sp.]
MYKKIFPILILLISFSFAYGQNKPVLKFNTNGKFKIVQFTDVHFRYDSYRSDSALKMVKQIIELEKPDLIMLTGDIVCSKNTKKAWIRFTEMLTEAKTPWAYMLGNHDAEEEMSKKEIIDFTSKCPYSLTEQGPQNINGNGNYILRIQESTSKKTAAVCYILDSGMGLHPKETLGAYEWIHPSQVNWYVEQSKKLTKENKNTPYPALAFFHIPLPEYKEVIGKETTAGHQNEKTCSPELNSGLFTAMIECKDVMATFAGHDHNNNYIGNLRGICLAYGNASGRQSYGSIGRGARVIELYEGERKFDTWILKLYECDRDTDLWEPTKDTDKKFFVTYPDSFKE